MPHYPYVIIGGGMAAAAAVEGIGEVDSDQEIAIISGATQKPYDRPPLSKALWKGDKKLEEVFRPLDERVTFYGDCTVTRVVPDMRRVIDDHDTTYTYDKLLLA